MTGAFAAALLIASHAAAVTLDAEPSSIDVVVTADGPAFVVVPFDVPTGTVELQVTHAVLSTNSGDVLDFGVDDPNGFRGWGGGNDEPVIIGVLASSRSYRTGPMEPGTWMAIVGRARLVSATAAMRLTVQALSVATLPDDADVGASRDWNTAVGAGGTRYYAGDLHVHSRDSGDASASLDEIEDLALSKGLDFVVITDHNTDAHVPHLARQQSDSSLLWIPGMEFTTYQGHLGVFGSTTAVDQKLGLTTTVTAAMASLRNQGALLVMNHPALDLGDLCIGCAWQHDTFDVDAVEVATGGYLEAGYLFQANAISFWEGLVATGIHAAPVGGSDDHRAGIDLGAFQSPIGNPTTRIEAEELSLPALITGIRNSRTVVQMQGPDDPMIITTTPERVGDAVVVSAGTEVTMRWQVSNAAEGDQFRIIVDGAFQERVALTGSTDISRTFVVPAAGELRVRGEVERDDHIAVLTGYTWLRPSADTGCGCGGGSAAVAALGVVIAIRGRHRARSLQIVSITKVPSKARKSSGSDVSTGQPRSRANSAT